MSKLILSGDMTRFRCDMVIRILEAVKFEGEIQIDGPEKAQVFMSQGRMVGARTATQQGLQALLVVMPWTTGIFAARETQEILKTPDLSGFPDNISIFRHLQSLKTQPLAPSPVATRTTAPIKPGVSGPLGRIPELTEKGRITLKTLQTNYALRGVQVEDDLWKVLAKVDGKTSLHQIGSLCNVQGDPFNASIEELQTQGLIKFKSFDPVDEQLKSNGGRFRFGEYLVAKGVITDVQLQAALNRQAELARKGRYMWLGEIMVDLNYVRPGQVQEALTAQKRQNT